MEDPFAKIVNTMRGIAHGQQSPVFLFGRIVSVSPLKVSIENADYAAGELYANDLIFTQNNGNPSYEPLQSGDEVLCIPYDSDYSKMVILCRMVSV